MKKFGKKMKLTIEIDNRKINYQFDADTTLRNIKNEIFYPFVSDVKMFHNNLDLTKAEGETLDFLFRDFKNIHLKVVNYKDQNRQTNNTNSLNSDPGVSRDDSKILDSSMKNSKKELDSSICGCAKHISKNFCRYCFLFLCDKCKDNKGHKHHLIVPISYENLEENINTYKNICQLDISSHMKLLKIIKVEENTNKQKPNPILNNGNLSHSNLNQFEFYEKLKVELINNLNIQIENSSFNLGLNSDSNEFMNSLDLLEMRLKFSTQNLDEISNLNNLKNKQISFLDPLTSVGNENINDSQVSLTAENSNFYKNPSDKLLSVFKNINELEKSLRPTYEIVEKIKIILKMKQNIIDLENKIKQNLENSISAINKMKVESSNFLPDVVNVNNTFMKNLNKFEKGSNNISLTKISSLNEDEIKYINLEKAKMNIIKKNIRANSSKYKAPKEINYTQMQVNASNSNLKPNKARISSVKNLKEKEKSDKKGEKPVTNLANSTSKSPRKRNLIEELKITELSDEKYDTYRTMEMKQKTENENAISVQYNAFINNDSNYTKILQMLKDSFSKGEFLNDPVMSNEDISHRLISLINFNAFSYTQFSKKKTNISLDYFREGIIGRNVISLNFSQEILNFQLENSKKIGQPHKIIEDFVNYLLPLYILSTKENSIFDKILNFLYLNVKKYLNYFFCIPKKYLMLQGENQNKNILENLLQIISKKFSSISPIEKNENENIDKQNSPLAILTDYQNCIISRKIWENFGFEISPMGKTSKGIWENWEKNLNEILEKNKERPLIIIAISAICNYTGLLSPIEEIGNLIYDFKFKNPNIKDKFIFIVTNASLISYKKIDVERLMIDALLISPKDLIGGYESSDIIILNKNLNTESQENDLNSNLNFSEKTQKKFSFIRSGACFQLLERIGFDFIEEKENEISEKFIKFISTINQNWSLAQKKNNVEILLKKEEEKKFPVFAVSLFDEFKNRISHDLIHRIIIDIFGIHLEKDFDKNGSFGIDFVSNIDSEDNKSKSSRNPNEENAKVISTKQCFLRFKLNFFDTEEDVDYLVKTFKLISEQIMIFFNNFYTKESDQEFIYKPEVFQDVIKKIEDNGKLQEKIFGSTNSNTNKMKDEYEEIMQFDIFNNFMVKEVKEDQRVNLMKKRLEVIEKVIGYFKKNK